MFKFRIFQSFRDALRGCAFVFRTEQNFRIQVVVAIFAISLSVWLPLRSAERVVVLLLVTMVLTMELLNTALEYFTDLLKPRLHQYVQSIKDIMAGAVLLTSLAALTIGLIIFVPYFIH